MTAYKLHVYMIHTSMNTHVVPWMHQVKLRYRPSLIHLDPQSRVAHKETEDFVEGEALECTQD